MWIFLNDAFFSIVSKDCARDELKDGCLLAKHLPRLRAMANKGVT